MARRASTILLNSLSSYGRMGLSLFVGLLITRTALHVLDAGGEDAKATFGLFTLLLAVATTSNFVNDGLQRSLVRHLAARDADGESLTVGEMFTSGCVVSWAVGLLIAAVIWVVAPWVVGLLHIQPKRVESAVWVFRIVGLGQLGVSVLQPWRAALLSRDRYLLENVRALVERLMTLGALALLPTLGAEHVLGLAIAWQAPQAVTLIATAAIAWHSDAAFRPALDGLSVASGKALLSLGGWSGLISLGSSLYERTDQVLINLFVGPAGNAIYAVAVQLQSYGSSAVTAMSGVLLPTASRLSTHGSVREQQELIVRATRYAIALSLPLAVGVSAFAEPLVRLWLGPGFDSAAMIIPLVLVLMVLRAPNAIGWIQFTAADKLKLPTLALLLDGICNVFMSVFYVKAFGLGIAGVVAGTLTTNIMRFVGFQIPYSARLLHMRNRDFWLLAIAKPLSALLWLCPLAVMLAILDGSLIGAMRAAAILVLLYSGWMWLVVFDDYERALLKHLMERLVAGVSLGWK